MQAIQFLFQPFVFWLFSLEMQSLTSSYSEAFKSIFKTYFSQLSLVYPEQGEIGMAFSTFMQQETGRSSTMITSESGQFVKIRRSLTQTFFSSSLTTLIQFSRVKMPFMQLSSAFSALAFSKTYFTQLFVAEVKRQIEQKFFSSFRNWLRNGLNNRPVEWLKQIRVLSRSSKSIFLFFYNFIQGALVPNSWVSRLKHISLITVAQSILQLEVEGSLLQFIVIYRFKLTASFCCSSMSNRHMMDITFLKYSMYFLPIVQMIITYQHTQQNNKFYNPLHPVILTSLPVRLLQFNINFTVKIQHQINFNPRILWIFNSISGQLHNMNPSDGFFRHDVIEVFP